MAVGVAIMDELGGGGGSEMPPVMVEEAMPATAHRAVTRRLMGRGDGGGNEKRR